MRPALPHPLLLPTSSSFALPLVDRVKGATAPWAILVSSLGKGEQNYVEVIGGYLFVIIRPDWLMTVR
jgi:hypothetical protein